MQNFDSKSRSFRVYYGPITGDRLLVGEAPPGLLRRHRDAGPFVHLHPGEELVAAVLRAEERCLAFFHVEPIFAERIEDVRLMRDENGVGACLRGGAEHLVKCLDTAAVLVRRHDEAALGEVRCLLDILEARDDRGFIRSIVLASVDLADGNTDLTEGVAESLG